MKLSILIPAYNEEQRLGPMLDAYLPFFRERYGDEVELIVVVNGSRDRTAEVARTYAASWPCLRVIEEPRSVGKGGAVMLGMDAAKGALVGFVDADGATPPEAFDELVRRIGRAGIVIANRWHRESRITPQPWLRRMASRVFNALVRVLFKLHTTDTQCGAKLLSRPALDAVRPRLGITQWAFDVDLLFQVRRAGFPILEIPTVWDDKPGSRLRVGRTSLEMFVAIVRLRLVHSSFRWVVTLYDHTLSRHIHRGP